MAKAKQTTQTKPSQTPLSVTLFTDKEAYKLHNMRRNFEALMYDFYKDIAYDGSFNIFGVKSDIVPVNQLEESKFSPIYDEYVINAKRLGEDFFGVQLDFYWEKIEEKRENEYGKVKAVKTPVAKDAIIKDEDLDDV